MADRAGGNGIRGRRWDRLLALALAAWVLALVLLGAAAARRARRGRVLETDLLAMLPATEANPVAETAVRALGAATRDRAVFLAGAADPARAEAAARDLAAALRRSGAFTRVTAELPPVDPGAVARFYVPYRFRLPRALGAERAAGAAGLRRRVEARLASPAALAPGLDPAADPLGDLGGFLAGLPLAQSRFQLRDGLLTLPADPGLWVLVAADLRGSAFDPEVQRASMAAVGGAERALQAAHPGVDLLRTGAVFYAAEARSRAQWEVEVISWGSLAAILALFILVFRSARHLLLGLGCVAAGLAAGAAATLLADGRIHLLTLVCGASMVGVAVDYPFLCFAHHLGLGPDWEARGTLRRLLPALLLGWGTTLLGFAALGAAPFPGLRQMALFSMAGLAASFITLLLAAPFVLRRPVPGRPRLMAALELGLGRWLAWWRRPGLRRALPVLAALLVLAAGFRLRAVDDVRALIQPTGALPAQEARIRALTGLSNDSRFFLVEGRDEGAVLEREEALRERLEPLRDRGFLDGVQAVSAFVPSPARQARALATWTAQAPDLARALRALGFREPAWTALERDLAAAPGRPLTVAALLANPFAAPYRMLWLGSTERGVASMVYPAGTCDSARLREAAAGLPGVVLVDKTASVSALLGHYRRVAQAALVLAVLLVAAALLRWYGLRRGCRVLAPSLAGMLAALGGLAILGLPLTLFGTIALVLVLGFGVDYAVFLGEAGEHPGPALLGTLLAGFSTLLSYGLLAFSRTPALRGFGVTLGLGVLVSVLLAPLAKPDRTIVE